MLGQLCMTEKGVITDLTYIFRYFKKDLASDRNSQKKLIFPRFRKMCFILERVCRLQLQYVA